MLSLMNVSNVPWTCQISIAIPLKKISTFSKVFRILLLSKLNLFVMVHDLMSNLGQNQSNRYSRDKTYNILIILEYFCPFERD